MYLAICNAKDVYQDSNSIAVSNNSENANLTLAGEEILQIKYICLSIRKDEIHNMCNLCFNGTHAEKALVLQFLHKMIQFDKRSIISIFKNFREAISSVLRESLSYQMENRILSVLITEVNIENVNPYLKLLQITADLLLSLLNHSGIYCN